MWHTNIAMDDPEVNRTIRFQRLVPLLTLTPSQMQIILKPSTNGKMNWTYG